MKHLIVQNVGPINHIDVELKRFNFLIGSQSSGKSTIAKIYSTCSWMEKEMATTLNEKVFENGDAFVKKMETFHKMKGYFSDISYISYETDIVSIIYENRELLTKLKARYDYKRIKICYVPAERNMVTLPELRGFEFGATNVRSFLFDWLNAKKLYNLDNKSNILNLGLQYYYDGDKEADQDRITHINGKTYDIPLASASSGVQSLTPLLIMFQYYTDAYFKTYDNFTSFDYDEKQRMLKNNLTDELVLEKLFPNFDRRKRHELIKEINDMYRNRDSRIMPLHETYKKTLENLTIPIRTSFIVEEPEQNLFPYTQLQLLDAVAALCQKGRQHELFFTTHSPYIINYLNVMLRRSQEEGKPYISADDIMIQMVMEGKLQNLLAVDERNGEQVVDTYDLSEPIETIFRQYKQLGYEVATRK